MEGEIDWDVDRTLYHKKTFTFLPPQILLGMIAILSIYYCT